MHLPTSLPINPCGVTHRVNSIVVSLRGLIGGLFVCAALFVTTIALADITEPGNPIVGVAATQLSELELIGAPANVFGTKAVSGTLSPGGTITYTVVLTNGGLSSQPDNPGDEFVDILPAGLTLVSANATSGTAVATFATNTVTWSGSIPPDGPVTIAIAATINGGTAGSTISNQGTISYDADGNGSNDSNRATDDPATEEEGDPTSFTVCGSSLIVSTTDDSGPGSLRVAISGACPNATITFAPALTSGGPATITLTSGELLIDKNLTIIGPGANLLSIARSTSLETLHFRIFQIPSGSTVNMSGVTITNGSSAIGVGDSDEGVGGVGGGILNNAGATLNLKNVAIKDNQTGAGNTAGGPGGAGGGVHNFGTLNIVSSTVSGNRTGDGGASITGAGNGGDGGGISNNGTLTIINSTISGNQTGAGASSAGGGASSGGKGGGIANSSGTVTIINSTISDNHAGAGGTGSAGGDGGGVFNQRGGTATVRNSIISGNSVANGGAGPDFSGSFTSLDYNLLGSSAGATISGTITHNIINQSANLSPLSNHGGPTETMLPLPGSPAINAGDDGTSLPQDTFDADGDSITAETLPVDQRGFARVADTNFDIGAVETKYSITATGGSAQSAVINTAFAIALKATVKESGINLSGVPVTFNPPASGPSGSFAGSNTVITDSNGVATAPTFIANGTAGLYSVVASLSGGALVASFALSNTRADQIINFGPLPNKQLGDPDFTVNATSTSGLPVTFTVSGQCTIVTNTVHITAPGVCTVTASQGGNANFNAAPDVSRSFQITNAALISFSQSNYGVNENTGFVTITVNRNGDLSIPVNVDFASDDSGSSNDCSILNGGMASSRCDFGLRLGTLKFAATETQKTFRVPITQDSYSEGPEVFSVNLSNLGNGANFVMPSSATVTITDGTTVSPNAIDNTEVFVRQHYRDFLNREADQAGLTFWVGEIDNCTPKPQCTEVQRINTSAAFFLSIEFQTTGNVVRSFYVAALNRPATNNMPEFVEFTRDTQAMQLGLIVDSNNNDWQTVLNNNLDAFMRDFVTRPEFMGLYPTTDTPTQYVDKLYLHAGITPTADERNNAIAQFGTATTASDAGARGRALLEVTENTTFKQREKNPSFVQMQYFGYLRRNPNDAPDSDFAGFDFWLAKLNQFNGNYIEAEMVKAFISTPEYRHRFGP